MHRYGWAVPEFVEGSVAAMDAMVARIQPRGFERLAPELRPLLESPPKPLKRQPNRPPITTQFRVGDVLSIHHGQHWRGGYVVDISNDKSGMYPVVSFFDGTFDSPPTHAELAACVAKGKRLNDGLVDPEPAEAGHDFCCKAVDAVMDGVSFVDTGLGKWLNQHRDRSFALWYAGSEQDLRGTRDSQQFIAWIEMGDDYEYNAIYATSG